MTKKQAMELLVDHVLEIEHDDFFEEDPEPSAAHPWYLAHLIKFGEESANLKLKWALKNNHLLED